MWSLKKPSEECVWRMCSVLSLWHMYLLTFHSSQLSPGAKAAWQLVQERKRRSSSWSHILSWDLTSCLPSILIFQVFYLFSITMSLGTSYMYPNTRCTMYTVMLHLFFCPSNLTKITNFFRNFTWIYGSFLSVCGEINSRQSVLNNAWKYVQQYFVYLVLSTPFSQKLTVNSLCIYMLAW